MSLYVNLTWSVDEVTVAQPSDFHPLQKEHGGSDVRLSNVRAYLSRKLSVLGVQTKTLAYRKKRSFLDRTAAGNMQLEIYITTYFYCQLVELLTCWTCQLFATRGLACADWLNDD